VRVGLKIHENICKTLCAGQLTGRIGTFIVIDCLNMCLFREAVSREMSPMICGDFDGACSKM
jgi:hypothetical protein